MTDRPRDGEPPEEPVDADLPGMEDGDLVEADLPTWQDPGQPTVPKPTTPENPEPYVPKRTADADFTDWLHSTGPIPRHPHRSVEEGSVPVSDPALEAPGPEFPDDLEPMEDPTVREAFTDEIDRSKLKQRESTLSQEEALELLGETLDEEAKSRALRELEERLEGDASEVPEWMPIDPDPIPYPSLPPPQPARRRPWLRWFAVGAFGGLGLILLRLTVFGDATPATTTLGAVPSTTQAIVLETTPTQPISSTTAPDSSTTSAAVALDPADQVRIIDFEAVADAAGDLWVILSFQSPWLDGPPASDFAQTALVGAGVEIDGAFHSSLWSVSDGTSYAEGTNGASAFPRTSRQEPIVQTAMWVTPDGRLAMRLPGSSPGGSLDAGLVTPDTPLILLSSLVADEGSAPVADNRNTVLGDVAGGSDYPLAYWVELEPDTEPIVLDVPGG